MHSAFFQLLDEDGLTEMYKGNKRHIFVAFFPELSQKVTWWMNIFGVGVVERQIECYVECVSVQHIECTYSVQCATELSWR